MSFVISCRKAKKYLNQSFLQDFDQEPCEWNSICQILILPLWLVTPPCFLIKLPQILQKVIVFFLERERWNKDFILTYLDSSIAEVFPHYYLFFFDFVHLQEGKSKRGLKVGPKVLTLGPSLFHKYSKLHYTTANAILMKLTKIMFLHESEALV